jgi:hypothetical protein
MKYKGERDGQVYDTSEEKCLQVLVEKCQPDESSL